MITITIVLNLTFALVTAVSLVRLFRGMVRLINKSDCTLLYSLLLLMLLATIIFSIIGSASKSNFFLFAALLTLTLLIYFNFCWLRLALSPTRTGNFSIIFRPIALASIIAIWLVELIIIFLAGPDDLNNLLISDAGALTSSFWLWAGSTLVISYIVASELMLFYKGIRGIRTYDDTQGLGVKFALFTYTNFIILSLLNFVVTLVDLVCLRLYPSQIIPEISTGLTNILNLVFFLYLLVNNFDRFLFKLFEKWHDNQTLKLLKELQPLYSRALELYPAPYRHNAYGYLNSRSGVSILRSVINGLTDIRMQLHRANAQKLADEKGMPVEDLTIPDTLSFNQELKLWKESLYGRDKAETILNLVNRIPMRASISVPQPGVRGAGNRPIARYYKKLANKLEVLKLPELKPARKNDERNYNPGQPDTLLTSKTPVQDMAFINREEP